MAKVKKESSSLSSGNVKGFLGPLSSSKKSKKNNVSKPYGEPDLFESQVALKELNSCIDEVVVKRGEKWAVIDNETGAQVGSYDDRQAAYDRQKQIKKQHDFQRKTKQEALEIIKKAFVSLLKEGSMLSYVFEQNPTNDNSVFWDKFIAQLSKETVLSDDKFKALLMNIAKNEVRLLNSAVDAVAKVLEDTKSFIVKKKNVDHDSQGNVAYHFSVHMKENNKKLDFGVKLEHGRPVIIFPDVSRQILNSLSNDESKLLRAELIHAQETALDNMDSVEKSLKKRNEYLNNLENKMDRMLNSLNPLQISMLRTLLKNKYKTLR